MSVAILGCGPSGLAVALAAVNSGRRVLIASGNITPSRQYGCQYLHAPMPGYEHVAHARVEYHLNGTADQYRRKVYGSKWEGKVSPEDFIGEHDAWDIRATYMEMWRDLYANERVSFIKARVDRGLMPDAIYSFRPDAIFSTIPATDLCYRPEHEFRQHGIYASGTIRPGTDTINAVVCDGTRKVAWYRNACVFGYRTIEWPRRPTNGDMAVPITKPLTTDCTCYPEIHRIGRYGKWKKSYLVHQAYPEVLEILG